VFTVIIMSWSKSFEFVLFFFAVVEKAHLVLDI
jgi:hypothetical protein